MKVTISRDIEGTVTITDHSQTITTDSSGNLDAADLAAILIHCGVDVTFVDEKNK